MIQLVLRLEADGGPAACGLCGTPLPVSRGLCLSPADTAAPVCRDCGRKHAPALAALVELACAAEHVGRIGRHTVTPPLTALLDLARAAEDYAAALPERRAQAA